MVTRPCSRTCPRVWYPGGNGTGFSNRQVIDVVREVTGQPVPVEHAPRRDGDAVIVVASSEKAHAELGWQPRKPELTGPALD